MNNKTTSSWLTSAERGLGKLAEIANRVQARGLFEESCDILDWIQEVHTAMALSVPASAQPADACCKWPTCQSEEVQQQVADQAYRELYSGAQPDRGAACKHEFAYFGCQPERRCAHCDMVESNALALSQASQPVEPDLAALIHYPECWDTTAYHTLGEALRECVSALKCSECVGAPSDAKGKADLLDALQKAARLLRAAGFCMTGTATSQIVAAINAHVDAKGKADAANAGGRIAAYKLGDWFDAGTLDEMQAFYLSRLPAIREAAKEHGYAIGLHGSQRRDFDLMAMQWRDDASDKDTLAHAIAVAACGITHAGPYQWETKPSGRFAVSMPICWTDHGNPEFGDMLSLGHIDLSVIDFATSAADAKDAVGLPRTPTEAMLNAARDWSVKKYGIGVGNDDATGCWQVMYDAAMAAAPSSEKGGAA